MNKPKDNREILWPLAYTVCDCCNGVTSVAGIEKLYDERDKLRAEVESLRARPTFDKERVREIIELTEYDGIDRWNELKKELGLL